MPPCNIALAKATIHRTLMLETLPRRNISHRMFLLFPARSTSRSRIYKTTIAFPVPCPCFFLFFLFFFFSFYFFLFFLFLLSGLCSDILLC